ncbi:MAG: TIGR04255 family protein, partial [Anaerolineae bacterium]|nr:TIGR04255 family protein [Anaerolineae bacterium]
LGPGIITFNDTKDYGWDSFREQGVKLVEKLFEIYPKNQLSITHLQLRYINAVSFNILDENIITYIKDNLKIGFDFPKELFSKSPIQEKPSNLNTVFSFPISDPNGTLSLKLANGKHENTPALIWEIIVQSVDKDIPKMPESFENWFTAANTIIHNTFFNLIEGSLEKKFK